MVACPLLAGQQHPGVAAVLEGEVVAAQAHILILAAPEAAVVVVGEGG